MIWTVLTVLVILGFLLRHFPIKNLRPAPAPAPAPKIETPAAPAKVEPRAKVEAPAVPSKIVPAPDAPWEFAGTKSVDGESMTIVKRGIERMLRRKDGSPLEQYVEIDGKREGLSTRWFPSGNVYCIGEWRAGLQNGAWTYFQDDGSVSQKGQFTEGKREGEWESYYSNGNLRWRGSYQNDQQVGAWAFVKENGEVDFSQTGDYLNGKKVRN